MALEEHLLSSFCLTAPAKLPGHAPSLCTLRQLYRSSGIPYNSAMQKGEYIRDRLLPSSIQAACDRQAITYQAFSDDWVLKLSKGGRIFWVFGYKFDINPSAVSLIAQDKVATYLVLAEHNIPAVPHILARSLPGESINRAGLKAQFTSDIVIKPLSGTGGRDVTRYADITEALTVIEASNEPAWAVSPYLNIEQETRCIVLDGDTILAYEKQQPEIINGLKFFNLSHGAIAVDVATEALATEVQQLARDTCKQLGLRLAAVDIVTLTDGTRLVLEVNDGFSMEYYARQSEQNKNRAISLYDTIVAAMFA